MMYQLKDDRFLDVIRLVEEIVESNLRKIIEGR